MFLDFCGFLHSTDKSTNQKKIYYGSIDMRHLILDINFLIEIEVFLELYLKMNFI